MNNWTLYLLPFISAFIGWFTNLIAIKMLFHPKEPVKVLGLTFQGIFPKRQKQFATKLGQLVAKELINFGEISKEINDPRQLQSVRPLIEEHIEQFLQHKLKEKLPLISMFVGSGTLEKIKEGLMEEIDILLPVVLQKFTGNLSSKIDVEQIVFEKVNNFSSDKFEEILLSIMSKEFKFVEIIGGVLGFLIGVFQVLLTLIGN